ncbi:MAG: type II toxin-antitoxin system ParD family antitoxin [Pseudomonadota bacterium]
MSTVRKTITLTKKQEAWIKAQIGSGDFTNESEYLRSLIRRDQAKREKLIALKAAIQEGVDSGTSKKSVDQIWQEAEQKKPGQQWLSIRFRTVRHPTLLK